MPGRSAEGHFDYAIIGMGIGGLTLGALLAHVGKKVVIFEQHEVPGGYGHTFRQGRFSFLRRVALRVGLRASGAQISVGSDPVAAATDADAVYTDAWLSMGDPAEEHEKRFAAFRQYQINATLIAHAKPDAIFMHCLPDHRGEEVTAEVVDGAQSVVFDQAENRLHTPVALLDALLTGKLPGLGGE